MKVKLLSIVLALQLAAFVAAKEDGKQLEQVEMKLTRAMDILNAEENVEIYGDMITLEKMDVDEKIDETGRSEDPLVASIETFFRTHRIRIRLPNDGSSADLFGRALGRKDVGVELRGLAAGASEARTKLKKMVLPLLLLLKVKMLTALLIVAGVIAMIGMKAIGGGLLALLISGMVSLKSLLSHPPTYTKISYGIAKPEIYHDQWHRSQDELEQPYRGWAPEYNPEQYPFPDVP